MLYLTMAFSYFSCYIFKTKFFKDYLSINEANSIFIFSASFLVTALGAVIWPYLADLTARPKFFIILKTLLMCGFFQLFQLMVLVPERWRESVQVFVILCWTFSYSALRPLLDSIVVRQLEVDGYGKELYGRQRLWLTLGFAAVTYLVGGVIDTQSHKPIRESYLPLFWILFASTALFVGVAFFTIPNDNPKVEFARRKIELEKKQPSGTADVSSSRQQLVALMSNASYISLLLITMVFGYAVQNMYVLRGLYIEERILGDDAPDKKSWVGILTVTGVFMEIIVFFYGENLLKRFEKDWLLCVALLSITLRVGAYVILPENDRNWMYFVLFVEIFIRGIGNGAIQIAAVDRAAEIAGPDLQFTSQGVFAAVYNGLSGSVGSIGSGIILKMTGSIKYAFAACVSLTGFTFIVLFVYLVCVRR